MTRTEDRRIVEALQKALTEYLDHHRVAAYDDPEWLEEFNAMTQTQKDQLAGCGCKLCDSAGYLRGSI